MGGNGAAGQRRGQSRSSIRRCCCRSSTAASWCGTRWSSAASAGSAGSSRFRAFAPEYRRVPDERETVQHRENHGDVDPGHASWDRVTNTFPEPVEQVDVQCRNHTEADEHAPIPRPDAGDDRQKRQGKEQEWFSWTCTREDEVRMHGQTPQSRKSRRNRCPRRASHMPRRLRRPRPFHAVPRRQRSSTATRSAPPPARTVGTLAIFTGVVTDGSKVIDDRSRGQPARHGSQPTRDSPHSRDRVPSVTDPTAWTSLRNAPSRTIGHTQAQGDQISRRAPPTANGQTCAHRPGRRKHHGRRDKRTLGLAQQQRPAAFPRPIRAPPTRRSGERPPPATRTGRRGRPARPRRESPPGSPSRDKPHAGRSATPADMTTQPRITTETQSSGQDGGGQLLIGDCRRGGMRNIGNNAWLRDRDSSS